MHHHSLRITAALFLCLWFAVADAQEIPGCGSLQATFGPFDYRDPTYREKELPLVEQFHFTRDVESLTRGKSSAYIIDDLGYTLRAFPNHHRALASLSKYALSGGWFHKDSPIPSADCYFRRAIVFRPDDEVAHMIYAGHLYRIGRLDAAREQYDEALRLAPSDAEVNYNVGLFYFRQGDIARAKQLAKIAYDGGYPLPGLRNMIAAAEAKAGK